MQWFDDADELAQAARFRDVTAPKRADLSWARSATEADEGSLKPPRVPAGFEDAASDAPRELEPSPSMLPPPPADLEGLRTHDSGQHRLDLEPPPARRMDTMIDDIVPRAEEEAFVAIREAVAHAEAARDAQFICAENRLVDLAMMVARRVIAREVSLDPQIVVGLVREGMSALGERDQIVVRVGTFFRDMREELQQKLGGSKLRCEVVIDPSLGRSGCVVETDLGRVDESVDARLENALEAVSASMKHKGSR